MVVLDKPCKACRKLFIKRVRDSNSQWQSRLFCSKKCSNNSHAKIDIEHRFWGKVGKLGNNDCWNWNGSVDGNGYGTLFIKVGLSPKKAHRLSWEICNGKILNGLYVCHKCDNPSCVNPSHLFLGTAKENMKDCSLKGRLNPISKLNLHPGEIGMHGAGSKSTKEIQNEQRN